MASQFSNAKIVGIHKAKLAEIVRTSSSDDRTGESKIEKALTDFSEGRGDQAVADLSKMFAGRARVSPAISECGLQFLVDICLTTDHVSSLKDPLRFYQRQCATNKMGLGPMERAIKYLISRVQEMVMLVRGESVDTSSDPQTKLLHVLGISEEATSNPWLKLPNAVCYLLCDRRLFYVTHQCLFLFCISHLLDMCVVLKSPRDLFIVKNSLNEFCTRLYCNRERHPNTTEALKNNTVTVAEMRFKLLATALTLGNWDVVRDALRTLCSLFKDVEHAVKEHNKSESEKIEFPLNKVAIGEQRFRVVSEVFLENRNWVYNAQATIQQSRFTSDPIVLSRAILATVCITPSQAELVYNESSEDFERQSLIQIAEMLTLPSVPKPHELRADLLKKSDLQSAHPSALALLNLVVAGAVVDLAEVYKHLKVLQGVEWATPYVAALERSLLEEYMSAYFATKPLLQMTEIAAQVLYPDVNDVHLIAISCGATVDVVGHVATFNTAEHTVRNSLEALNTAVGTALAVPIAKRRRELPAGAAKSLELQLEREMKLIETLNTEQNRCLNNADTRRRDRERKMREEEQRKKDETREAESEAHVKNLQRNLADLRKLLVKAEEKYRRKRCIAHITEKYPGINIPSGYISLDTTQFIEKCVSLLAPYTIKMEEAKSTAVRDANYFERSVREVEVPIRRAEENDEEAKAKNREEQQRRVQNYKDQHRAKYNRAKELKDIMDSFRKEADAYMAEKVEAAMSSQKVTKRDAQEEDLEAEKRRLAELAGETIAAPAARATPAVSAAQSAPQAEPVAAAPTGARWVPKSKRA